MSVLDAVIEIVSKYYLCDRCLGRLFAQLGRGYNNAERGRSLKIAAVMEIHRRILEGENTERYLQTLLNLLPYSRDTLRILGISDHGSNDRKCSICGNTIEKIIERYASKVADLIVQEGVSSFIVGIVPPRQIVENEKKVISEFSLRFWESVRSELKREIGKRVKELTGIEPNFEDPEAIFVIDVDSDSIRIEIPSILILGTYWKLGRRISQVPWIGRDGKKKYPLSIEEVLQNAAKVVGAERAIFHGAGREDVDVRMLGSGRPFVLELYRPRRRNIDMLKLEEAVNSSTPWIRIRLSMRVRRDIVSKLKSSASRGFKVYRALVATRTPVSDDDLKRLEEFFRNRVIEQWTPLRVIRRRKNILRRRRVHEVRTLRIADNLFEALVKCEGGLYVKELISGDQGRTVPSFSDVLGTEATCIELDVIYVQKYI